MLPRRGEATAALLRNPELEQSSRMKLGTRTLAAGALLVALALPMAAALDSQP